MRKIRIFTVLFLFLIFNIAGDSKESTKKVTIGFTENFKAKDLVIKNITYLATFEKDVIDLLGIEKNPVQLLSLIHI